MSDDAAAILADADALIIGAGAGMGVDSGLPDFRGDKGFWRAYPPYEKLGLGFAQLANPRWFARDPALAWGFYGHRLNLYRATRPHGGFALLREWAARLPHGAFAYTSNVDGQFQRAGFAAERVLEIHGAIEWLQCTAACGAPIWPAPPDEIAVDPATFRAAPPHPACPSCGKLARPNILMFGDGAWDGARTDEQEARLDAWLAGVRRPAVVECGAGTAIPTVRHFCERAAARFQTRLIRINPRDHQGPAGTISLAYGALEGLRAINSTLLPNGSRSSQRT
jgi:NAD-dependent SIR2 family protein deacetylase